ncbi:hypothetical protein FJY90_05335 [Candidatus Gottesmanbacteria bacterium]|nr:hypothetical protein [Candidatus Gottesmanbacteria bacterium]
MKKIEEITTFLKNNSLLEWKLSCSAIDWDSLCQAKGGSVFFGVGLCTEKEPAVSIPFDILAFFLEAEKLRKFFDLAKVIVLIADTHALTNQFMTRNVVEKLSQQSTTTFEHIIKNLNLTSFEIRKASTMRLDSNLDTLFPAHAKLSNQYLIQEIADVIWMIRNDNLKLKLGWSIDSALEVSGHDERFFDLTMRELLPRQISFLFTSAGRTFDKHRQKVSPYISVKGEHRLLLTPNEPIGKKLREAEIIWSDKHFGGARKHLGDIIREFESLFGHLAGLSFEQKLQHINDVAMKGLL